jgi:CubicO group peptidase (beta-lactamase class C family)
MRILRHGAALLCAAGTLASTPSFLGAQQPSPAEVDAVFAAFDRAGSPGCALGVVRDGSIVYQRGYGYANLDYAIPNAPHMVFYVGSVSKQFTAASMVLLAADGLVGLDDDVRRYIPELPDYGRTITIRHLVHHTSGLRDIYTLMELAGIRLEDVFTDDEMLGLITRQRELNFPPGDDYLYSNSGYWLLGVIVRRVTGRSLREYADEKLFRPLGMNDTHFHDRPYHVMHNRVMSYVQDADDSFRMAYLANFDKVGAGGLYTTIGDLARWDANFYQPAVGGGAFLRTMHTRGVLTSGDTLPYAFGIVLQQRRGLDIVRHSGVLMGFRADLARYPSERLTVITLCNLGSIEASDLGDRVADLYLGARPEPAAVRPAAGAAPPAAARPPRPVPHDLLQQVAGRYRSDELDATWALDLADDGVLRVRRRTGGAQPLRPDGEDRFLGDGVVLTLQRDAAGAVVGFGVDAGRVRNIVFRRL